MYWFRRPPYLRWIAAAAVLLLGLLLDSRTTPLVRYPFAESTIAAGTAIEDHIAWREIPAGVLPVWPGTVSGNSATEIAANDPLLPSLVGDVTIPTDWWAVALPLPSPVPPGTHVRVVLGDGNVIEGVVIDGTIDTGFALSGTVAFAATDAALVATAVSNDALVVMIAAGATISESTG